MVLLLGPKPASSLVFTSLVFIRQLLKEWTAFNLQVSVNKASLATGTCSEFFATICKKGRCGLIFRSCVFLILTIFKWPFPAISVLQRFPFSMSYFSTWLVLVWKFSLEVLGFQRWYRVIFVASFPAVERTGHTALETQKHQVLLRGCHHQAQLRVLVMC